MEISAVGIDARSVIIFHPRSSIEQSERNRGKYPQLLGRAKLNYSSEYPNFVKARNGAISMHVSTSITVRVAYCVVIDMKMAVSIGSSLESAWNVCRLVLAARLMIEENAERSAETGSDRTSTIRSLLWRHKQ
jgi:hypothetical protein